MTITEITLEILAERTLTQFNSKKLVDWAVKVLELGYANENLYILAGLDFDTTEEREKYFWECLKDLKIEVEKDENKLIENYALAITNKVIKNEIDVEFAFNQMLKIVYTSDYDRRYIPFFDLDEDLDYLKYDNSTLYNSNLTIENSKKFILEEFKIFAEMERLKVPLEERSKSFCEHCKKLNHPKTKNKYQFKKPFKYLVWSCEFCGSEKLKYSSDHETKKIIIEQYRKIVPK